MWNNWKNNNPEIDRYINEGLWKYIQRKQKEKGYTIEIEDTEYEDVSEENKLNHNGKQE